MTRRERILLIVVGTVGVLLLFYYYVYAPKQAEIRRLTDQLAAQTAQRDRMRATAAQITRLQEEYQRLSAFIAQIETRLPAQKETPLLLVQLERLSRSVGVNLQSIRPSQLQPATVGQVQQQPARAGGQQAPPGGPTYLRFPIAMTIQATYDETIRLMAALRDFPRMIAVRSLAIDPRTLPELTLNVEAETYVLPREAR
ncbi:MAG: type 4a pilus biogenesis protein PilO [Armatimonadota bacterium]|nr:type 4a pilus biogenesis protein PilO [Armatimonadota bacterium]MDR7403149.1 type 4a pilus biogenesis protein PilO [Armatimonadota bacterium]